MISTRDLSQLPPIPELKCLLQSLATLDAIITLDDGGARYYFESRWGKKQQVGQLHNDSGDDFHAYFNSHGCFLKGFAHESTMSPHQFDPKKIWPGVLDGVPSEFDAALREPAFSMEETTFAIWRLNDDTEWRRGEIEFPAEPYGDGSAELLSLLAGEPASYVEWAEDYYEVEVDEDAVRHVYEHQPLTNDVVRQLNSEASLGELHNNLTKIDYPFARKSS